MGDRKALLVLALFLVLLLLLVPDAYSSESNANEELYEFLSSESPASAKLFNFLSDVVGLDLTKYGVVPPSVVPPGFEDLSPLEHYKKLYEHLSENPPPPLPSDFPTPEDLFGGLVEQEGVTLDFEYNESKIHVTSTFYNGHMKSAKITPQGDYIYSEPQPTDILSQAKNIIQRYQTFASQNYAKDAVYLVPMQSILNSVNDLSPKQITEGNVTFLVTKDGDKTRAQWIYTEGGIVMNRKRVEVKFRNNTFVSFWDTWGLYNVSGLSEISSEEAIQIALEAAQNYELHIVLEDKNETEIFKFPDLSNAPYTVYMYMLPYRYQEDNIPSKIDRDPLTLYPYWQLHFYFNNSIGGVQGIQVGVWGDTGEIIYCSGFGYLGTSGPPDEQDTTSPDAQYMGEQNQLNYDDQPLGEEKQSGTINPLTLVVIASLVAVPILSISAIALYRKNRHK